MEQSSSDKIQFAPESSKIFAAANFANFYSVPLIAAIRAIVAIFLGFLFIWSIMNSRVNLFYLILALSIVYFVFEVYFRAKILHERPVQIKIGKKSNIADSFSLETARILLRNKNVPSLARLLHFLLKDKEISFAFYRADISSETLNQFLQTSEGREPVDWPLITRSAVAWAEREERNYIDKLDMLLSIFSQSKNLQKILSDKHMREEDLVNIVFWARSLFEKEGCHFWERKVETLGPGISEFWMGGWTLETAKYSVDITKHIRQTGAASFLVGRAKEIQMVEEVLVRREKRNVILLGPPGVGKNTIVHGLAEKSIQGLLPEALKYKRFLEIDVTALLAGAQSGELEKRIQNLLTEVSHAKDVVLFIPEIENLSGSRGTGLNITGHLLTALNSGNLQVIATSTQGDYRRYIEKESTFASLFEVIDVTQATKESTIRILEEAAPYIEARNKIVVTYKAIQSAIELSDRYFVDRMLPGKALDLLDESATANSINKKTLLEPADIEKVVSQKTNIPIQKATGQEARGLLNLEQTLHKRIVDQNEAIVAVSNALRRARTIERDSKRPIGVFLFLGPTGVGKTETAKALAGLYFKNENSVIRIDMSEYQEATSINRLIGAPPGTGAYEEGGEFTEKIRKSPYSLILLDELEKAHQKIQEAFLPVFDEGQLQDATGRRIVFTNTIIIATSNAGAEYIRESIQKGIAVDNLKKELLEKLQREGTFKPEFLNRFDDIVVYKPLSETDVLQIVRLLIGDLEKRLKKQEISIKVDDQATAWVAKSGFDAAYGARPLKRFIADNIEEKIAEMILSGQVKTGGSVIISAENNQLKFS